MVHNKSNGHVDQAHQKLYDLTKFTSDILLFYETVRPISGPSLKDDPYEISLGSSSTLSAEELKKIITKIRNSQPAFEYIDRQPIDSEMFYDVDRRTIAHHALSARIALTRDKKDEPLIIMHLFLDEGLYKGGTYGEKLISVYQATYATEPDDESNSFGAFSQMMRVLRAVELKDLFLDRLNQLVEKVKKESILERSALQETKN